MENQDHLPATKGDLRHFATKEDLQAFATKEDLRHFATKEDLRHFATKEDLRHFATKEDFRGLAKEILRLDTRTNARIDALDVKFTAKFDQVLSAIQGFAGKLDSYNSGQALHGHVLTEAQIQMKDHERRIKGLEDRFQ